MEVIILLLAAPLVDHKTVLEKVLLYSDMAHTYIFILDLNTTKVIIVIL